MAERDQTAESLAAMERVGSGAAFRAAQAAFDVSGANGAAPVNATSAPAPSGPALSAPSIGSSGFGGSFGGSAPAAAVPSAAPSFGLGGAQGASTGGNWNGGGGTTASSGAPASVAAPQFSADNSSVTLPEISAQAPTTPTPGPSGGGDTSGSGNSTDSQNGAVSSSGATSGGSSSGDGSSGAGGGAGGGDSGNGSVTTSENPGQGFLPNPLDPYAQIAYHFRLYVTGDSDNGKPITIAETGKTGFNIKDVTVQSFIGPNETTRNSMSTSVKITVVETMGTSFLDGLVLAHQMSNTKNYQKAYYWLSLYFLGYDATGQVRNPITTGMASSGQWKWKITIGSIDTSLTEGGATYTLNCTIIHDNALADEWLKLQEPYRITGKKVGEFLDNLTTAMNKTVVNNYQDALVTYKFKLHSYNGMPDPTNFNMIEGDYSRHDPYRARDMNGDSTRDDYAAALVRGQNVTEICEHLIGVTKQGHMLSIWGDQNGGGGDQNSLPNGQFRTGVFYRCYPEVTYGDFHVPTGNYKKTITLHIKPYRSQATQLHPQESGQSNEQKAVQAAKANTNKRYDYIFTGLNTSVINFDIRFNTAWQAQLPRFGGYDYFNDMVQTGAMYDTVAAEALAKYRQSQGQAQQSLNNAQSLGNQMQNGVSVDGRAPVQDSRLSSVLQGFQGFERQNLSGSTAEAQNALQQIQNFNMAAQQAGRGNSGSSGGGSGDVFVEDALANGQSPQQTYISFAQSAEGARRSAGAGVPGNHGNRARSVYGALLEQTYDTTMFQSIDLTIRGDPYWLGDTYDTIFKDTPPKDAPDITAGDVLFSLIFKYPNGVHESSGSVQFRNENTYTGLYRCTSVESHFADGQFTQILKGFRLPKVGADAAVGMGGSNATTAGSASASPVSGAGGLGAIQNALTSSANLVGGTFNLLGSVGSMAAAFSPGSSLPAGGASTISVGGPPASS